MSLSPTPLPSTKQRVCSYADCRAVVEAAIEKIMLLVTQQVTLELDERLKAQLTGLQLKNLLVLTGHYQTGLLEVTIEAAQLKTSMSSAMDNYAFFDSALNKLNDLSSRLKSLQKRRESFLISLRNSEFAFLSDKQSVSSQPTSSQVDVQGKRRESHRQAQRLEEDDSVQIIEHRRLPQQIPIQKTVKAVEQPKPKSSILQQIVDKKSSQNSGFDTNSHKNLINPLEMKRDGKREKSRERSKERLQKESAQAVATVNDTNVGKKLIVKDNTSTGAAYLTNQLQNLGISAIKQGKEEEKEKEQEPDRQVTNSKSLHSPNSFFQPPKLNLDLSGMESLNEPNPHSANSRRMNLRSEMSRHLAEKLDNPLKDSNKPSATVAVERKENPLVNNTSSTPMSQEQEPKARMLFRSNAFKDYNQ